MESRQTPFITLRNRRDASPTLRGYYYQIEQTVFRWLTLQPGQRLELERGEDIDLVSDAMLAQGEERHRLVEQVKLRESSLTLLTTGALEALANSYEHRQANPTITIFFKYTTNARIGHEKKRSFPDSIEGIRVWELLRQQKLPAARTRVLLHAIRKILKGATCPPKLSRATWTHFCNFVAQSSNDDLLRFVRAFEWSTQNEATPELRAEIEQYLRHHYHIHDEETVQACYNRLFLSVFQTLTRTGDKILTVEQRMQLLTNPAINVSENRILELIKQALDLELIPIKQDIEEIRQEIARLAHHGLEGENMDLPMGAPFDEGLLALPDPFVGRNEDRTWLLERLHPSSTVGILALRGMAGVGKTALAAWAIHHLRKQGAYPDGIAVIDCQGQTDALDVVARILTRFDPHRRSPRTHERSELYERTSQQLSGKEALVVLDNVEPALRIEETVAPLKRANVKFLVTARHALPHTAIPLSAQHDVPMLKDDEALTLFYHFMGKEANRPVPSEEENGSARTVELLGYHPLAIRVAGAYVADLHRDLGAFAHELETPRRVLELADGEVPQAVGTVLMQSVTALPEDGQRVFAALASFQTPEMSRNAAIALANALGLEYPSSMVDLLVRRALIDASVNEQMRIEGDRERLRMHILMHSLADDLFARWPEEERLVAFTAIGRYYAAYVNVTKEDALEYDEAPISTSLDWAYQNYELVIGVHICTGMRFFWRDRWRQDAYHHFLPWGVQAAITIAQITQDQIDWLRAAHLGLVYGQVLQNLGNLEQADEIFRWCLSLFQEYGDRKAVGGTYHQLAQNARSCGRWEEALDDLETSLAIAREFHDQQTEASSLGELGLIASLRGQWDLAEKYCEQALSLLGPEHDQGIKGVLLMRRGQVAFMRGQNDIARRYLQEGIPLQRQAYGPGGEVASLGILGQVALLDGQLKDADRYEQECLRLARSIGDRKGEEVALYGLGLVAPT